MALIIYKHSAPAQRCAWCEAYLSDEDAWKAFRGAKVSHGICQDCAKQFNHEEAT